MSIWEYGVFGQVRKWSKEEKKWSTTATFVDPTGTVATLAETGATTNLTRLGQAGWELVGPPEVANIVMRTGDFSDGLVVDDKAQWVERRFWLKRPVSS